MTHQIDITGQKFNRLTAISFSHRDKHNHHYWLFSCLCGNEKVIAKYRVACGHTKGCGCGRGGNIKHGFSGRKRTSEYRAWQDMKTRCLNLNDIGYHNYGGRGIKICDRWLNSFPNFLEDMGKR